MAAFFLFVLHVHIGAVIGSGSVFALRGLLRLTGNPIANHVVLRRLAVLIDTVLLTAGIELALIANKSPFKDAWLATKLLLLVLYIYLGILTLRRATTRAGQALAMAGALATLFYIVGVAVTQQPAGWLALWWH